MYKVLNEAEIKTYTEIGKQYPKLATLVINPTQPELNGITLETRGILYAIADKDGVEEIINASKKLDEQKIENILDLMPLDSDTMFFVG